MVKHNWSQVDDSGLQKRADPAGKRRESHRILKENSGKTMRNGSSIPAGIFWIFSGDFPAVSRENSQKMVIIHQEKSEDFRSEYCFHVPLYE
jgi:hypothetical protein